MIVTEEKYTFETHLFALHFQLSVESLMDITRKLVTWPLLSTLNIQSSQSILSVMMSHDEHKFSLT